MRFITFVLLFFHVVSCSSSSSKIVGKWKLEEIDYKAYFLDVPEEVKILLENQMKEEFERLKNKTYFEFNESFKLILEAPNYEGKQTLTEGTWKINSSEDSLFFELEDLENGQKAKYQIVGDDEADLDAGKISISSPIARALIGKEEGDVATFSSPGGNREVEILNVQYI